MAGVAPTYATSSMYSSMLGPSCWKPSEYVFTPPGCAVQ